MNSDDVMWKKFLILLPVAALTLWVMALIFTNLLSGKTPSGFWPETTQTYTYLVIVDHEPKPHPDRPNASVSETYYYFTNDLSFNNNGDLLLESPERIIEKRIVPGHFTLRGKPSFSSTRLWVTLPIDTFKIMLIKNPSRNWEKIPLDPIPSDLMTEPQ